MLLTYSHFFMADASLKPARDRKAVARWGYPLCDRSNRITYFCITFASFHGLEASFRSYSCSRGGNNTNIWILGSSDYGNHLKLGFPQFCIIYVNISKHTQWLSWISRKLWCVKKAILQRLCNLFAVVVQLLSCVQLSGSTDCSTPGFSVLHCLWEFAQIHANWVGNAI